MTNKISIQILLKEIKGAHKLTLKLVANMKVGKEGLNYHLAAVECYIHNLQGMTQYLAMMIHQDEDIALIERAFKLWYEIFKLHNEFKVFFNAKTPELSVAQFRNLVEDEKDFAIQFLFTINDTLERSQTILKKNIKAIEIKELAFSRSWAEGLSKEETLSKIDHRIKWCQDHIETLVLNPKSAHENLTKLSPKYGVDPGALPDTSPESIHGGIAMHEEIIRYLREWKKELEDKNKN